MNTSTVQNIARQSSLAARQLSSTSESMRNLGLAKMADSLESVKQQVLDINAQDLLRAQRNGQSAAMIKRLTINDKVFQYMLTRLRNVAQRPDPLNRVLEGHTNPAGLQVYKKTVPLGVVGIIYESRPNVTTDAAGQQCVCL
jgi:glutamate-5-semialdehyde dehydrogenase